LLAFVESIQTSSIMLAIIFYWRVQVSIRNIFVLLILTILFAGCANRHISEPLKGNRIAVISNFRDKALFQRAGTTTADNISFYRGIPKFRINPLVVTSVANDIYKNRTHRVIPIYHHTNHDLLTLDVSRQHRVTPEYHAYLSQLIAGKNIDSIVLIVPDTMDFGDGQYDGAIWSAAGYGLFNHDFVFIHTNKIFTAYMAYVIDAHTYRVIARSRGEFEKRTHDADIAWHKGYSGVTAKTLRVVKSVIKKELPAVLKITIRKLGLTGSE